MAKRRDDFYADDDRPRPRSRPRDDRDEDDYDRPRSRRRDDEDDEDRPRRRRKEPQGMHPGLIVGIIGGSVLLLAIIGVVVWLAVRGSSKDDASKDGGGTTVSGGITGNRDIDQALIGLKAADPGERRQAAEKLAGMQPIEQLRPTVASKLAQLVPDPDTGTRRAVVRALGLWATPNEVPTLIKYLSDQDLFTRMDALKHIGRFRDPRAAVPVVRCFLEFQTRGQAKEAILQMGSMAEPELLRFLAVKDFGKIFDRKACIEMLKDVGTVKSIPTLQDVLAETDIHSKVHLAGEAKAAIDAIQARR